VLLSQAEQLKERTKQFAIRIVRLFRSLPKTEEARTIGKQAHRSQLITVLYAGRVLRLSSLRRLARWWKKPMRRSFGWSYWLRPSLFHGVA
jgi:hypothetical protein